MSYRQDRYHQYRRDWRDRRDRWPQQRRQLFLTAPSPPPQLPYHHYDARPLTEPPHQSLPMPATHFPHPQARASNGLNPRSLAFDATEDLLPCHHYDARPLTEPPHQSLPMPTTHFPNPQARASNGLNPRSLAFDATEDLLPCHHYDARPLTEPPHQSLPMPTTQFPNPQARASNGLNPRSLAFDATEDLLPCHHYDARPLTEPPHQSLPMPTTQFPNPQARASNGLNPRSLAFDAPEVLPLTAAPPRSTQASPAMLAASIPLPLIGPGWRVAKDKSRLLFISPDLRLFKSSWGGIKYEACRRAKATADVMSTNVDPLTAPMNVSPTHSGEEEVDEAAVQAPTEQAGADRPDGYARLLGGEIGRVAGCCGGAAGAAAIAPGSGSSPRTCGGGGRCLG